MGWPDIDPSAIRHIRITHQDSDRLFDAAMVCATASPAGTATPYCWRACASSGSAIHDIPNTAVWTPSWKSTGSWGTDTTKGKFMSPFEAAWMALSGSKLLTGIK